MSGWQVPTPRQGPLAVQVTGAPPTQAPAAQLSAVVHALPSVHGVPSGPGGSEQTPVAGLQVPAPRQGPAAMQVTGSVPTHAPA